MTGRLIKVAVRMHSPEVTLVLHAETVRVDGAEVAFHVAGRGSPTAGSEAMREWLESLDIGAGGGRGGGGPVRSTAGTSRPAAAEEELSALRFPGKRKILEAGFRTEWVTARH